MSKLGRSKSVPTRLLIRIRDDINWGTIVLRRAYEMGFIITAERPDEKEFLIGSKVR